MNDKNYWLIPMDYQFCDYKNLRDEWHNYGKIMWQAPGKPKSINEEWKKNNVLCQGDVVYFYVTHLPSESRTRLSRIMLRGIIKDEPKPMEKGKVYNQTMPFDRELVYGFSITSLTTLSKDYLEDNTYLSYDSLKEKHKDFTYPQGMTCWPNKQKKNLSDELIDELEDSFKRNMQKNDFETLINHFKKSCFFNGKISGNHKTFTSRNGLDYYEYHHFIPQAQASHYPIEKFINSPSNGLFLCSNCHNRIHYGTAEDIDKMIDIALDDTNIKELLNDEFIKSIRKEKGEDDIEKGEEIIKEWFRMVYKVHQK